MNSAGTPRRYPFGKISRMCGRYALYGPRSRSRVESEYFTSLENFPGSWNVAPGSVLPITRAKHGVIEHVTARWGLVPYWAKDEKIGYKCINARSETVGTSASFKGPYRMKRRCLVPACGFYEWQKHPAGKQPYYITSADGSLLAFAGLWDAWKKPDGEVLTTFTVLTCEPNELVRPVHNRMPVIVEPDHYNEWLTADDPRELLQACPIEMLECYPVTMKVNSPRNDAPDLIDPAR